MLSRWWVGVLPVAVAACAFAQTGSAAGQESLSEQLEPLRTLVGKTWRGQVAENEAGDPVYDVSRWERVLNGNGIRIVHSVNRGDYGGETMVIWDAELDSLAFYYFTTAGFYTRGTIEAVDGRMVAREDVIGNEDGITVVESTTEFVSADQMLVTTRFLKQGAWTEPTEVTYGAAPDEAVLFR